jgi:hypothetical protein
LESILEIGNGGGVFSPWAQGQGLGFDGDGRSMLRAVVWGITIAVGFVRAFEQSTDAIEESFGFGHVASLQYIAPAINRAQVPMGTV